MAHSLLTSTPSQPTPVRPGRCQRAFARSGRPVYAEYGGLMYLAESLTDLDGHVWPMAGVLPRQS